MSDLRPETAALLAQFLGNGCRFDDDEVESDITRGGQASCVAYRGEDVAAITQTMKRLAVQHEEREERLKGAREFLPLLASQPGQHAFDTLLRDGVVRLDEICSKDLCGRLLSEINSALALKLDANADTDSGFGNVLCKHNRWDMYLDSPNKVPVFCEAMESMLGSSQSSLSQLFADVFCGHDADFHEFSSLISDCGSTSQPIHPDSQHESDPEGFSIKGPMYTVFVALQDVDENMGPTVFLPCTNNQPCHEALKQSPAAKEEFLAGCEYRMALLRAGDVCVMDSRCLHMGHANLAGPRRVLLYYTLRHYSLFAASNPPVPSGSIQRGLKIRMKDFLVE